jgi:hypothetical protein
MRKIIIATALLAFSATAALAQAGANPNAPQPGSTGVGVNQPGTTSTGMAVDKPDMKMPKAKTKKKKMK